MPRRSTAPAKVNLYLHVLGQRDDGLHQLDSLVSFAEAGDELSLDPDAPLALRLAGPFAAALAGEADNLVLRAARWLAARAGLPPAGHFHLTKRLPVAAGIGGGSADAAAALRLLAEAWAFDLATLDPAEVAAALGADLPVCLASRPCHVGGIGEELRPAPILPDVAAVLLNPGVAVRTGAVFAGLGPLSSVAAPIEMMPADVAGLAALLADRRNDLEPAATALAPEIATALGALRAQPGTLLARMSGSGATCFALFASAAEAGAAAAAIAAARPGWWVVATRIGAAC